MTQNGASIWPGAIGGIVATAVSIVLHSLFGTRLLAEIAVDFGSGAFKAAGTSFVTERLGGLDKPLLFASLTLLEIALLAGVWRLSVRLSTHLTGAARLLGAFALAEVALFSLAGSLLTFTPSGLNDDVDWPRNLGALTAMSMAFAGVATLAAADVSRRPRSSRASRRRFVARALSVAMAAAGLAVVGRELLKTVGGGARTSHAGKETPEVTANANFYIVSKNLLDPAVDAKGWRLRLGGRSRNLVELSYPDVLARPAVEEYATLQCISNPVGGDLMSNALWVGFRLNELLAEAQPLPSATQVLFRCADDYVETIPLEFAREDSLLLVHTMNGESLPEKHGFPLRLLAPGKYGLKHPKWITEIALMDEETFGYWQKRYWTQEARMNTSCRIDIPAPDSHITGATFRVHGVAFAGDRGVSGVEVSTDGGVSWHLATLKPALGPYTWVLWYYDWPIDGRTGHVEVIARTTDGAGETQTAVQAFPAPNGATGYPRVQVKLG